MYLHIGGDTMVRVTDIIGIFDGKAGHISDNQRSPKEQSQNPQEALKGMKSFVVTKQKIYYSPISTMTLKKRAEDDGTSAVLE